MDKPKLYQLPISPSCQRVLATLAHKGIDYDSVEIDITKKERPEEFNKISPFGKVPVLSHRGRNITESAVICQYIDEVWPAVPMMPADPLQRAYARQWILFADREIFDKDGRFVHVERDVDRKVETCRDLLAGLPGLDRELAGKKELFLGKELSLVDVILAPALSLLPIWSAIIGDKIYPDCKHIQAYTERLRRQPAVEKTVFSIPRDLLEGFFKAVLEQGLTVP